VQSTNAATAAALDQSAYVDNLYAKGLLTRSDWLKMKAGMAGQLNGAIEQAAGGKKAPAYGPSLPAGGETTNLGNRGASAEPLNGGASIENSPDLPSNRKPSSGSGNSVGSEAPKKELDAQVLDLKTLPSPGFVAAPFFPSEPYKQEFVLNKETAKTKALDSALSSVVAPIQRGIASSAAAKQDNHAETITEGEKLALQAQKIAQDRLMKSHADAVAARKKSAEDGDPSFKEAQASALRSMQELKKSAARLSPPGVSHKKSVDEDASEAMSLAMREKDREPNSLKTPWDKQPIFSSEEGASNLALLFVVLLGVFAGIAVAYLLFLRPNNAIVQLTVPGNGEHFTIRSGSQPGEFILDVMDVRGHLVRTAGTLRPHSVARAAVLPPDLAAQLGAKGSFDRFELTKEGGFIRTEKEEGYQIFPFVLKK
jgi:hypothetical protein